ncbi:uncharacterized protein PHACADRAFT_189696 [Phanerochaete carnosa HHB-10118-sp]|uniref:Uncharacterized protein n=1 Tax=Phanerochaete carnosa (strain HHB-10118-sp) TaxID=650164 RepID=K5WM98_PHACS|nr:uncharacterized protein PHACADRAFT_189696 [Phanerochaete carnosa HHB-10118-sp]EKM60570.1 hypothetical protein PHACADRAFT_189696 [Phanerochaete carnosa HHB-10118-sp]
MEEEEELRNATLMPWISTPSPETKHIEKDDASIAKAKDILPEIALRPRNLSNEISKEDTNPIARNRATALRQTNVQDNGIKEIPPIDLVKEVTKLSQDDAKDLFTHYLLEANPDFHV